MTNQIVTVNVSVQQAPEPNLLQKRGAFVSQGGTTLNAGTYSLLTQESDLTPLLSASLANTSLAWSAGNGGQITVTTTVAHGVTIGQQFDTTIAGATPAAYNGTYRATATGTSTFTCPLTSNPGTSPATVPGTYTPRGVGDLQAMANTFFAQGASQAAYVLELGAGEPAAGVTVLDAFITNSDQFFYSYLVPKSWDGVSSFITFMGGFTATTAKTEFFVTTNEQNYALYDGLKCVVPMCENPVQGVWAQNSLTDADWTTGVATLTTTTNHGVLPGQTFKVQGILPAGYNGTFIAGIGTATNQLVYALAGSDPGSYVSGGTLIASVYGSTGVPATEYSLAGAFWKTLNYSPNPSNKVTPLAFSYMQGVTEFQLKGNAALLALLKAAGINTIGNGGEGGISNKALFWGTTADVRPFNYWYSIDWVQIQAPLALANAVFNGSNDPVNPLFLDQSGIDRLQQAVCSVGDQAVANGLALGRVIPVGLSAADFQFNLNRGLYSGNLVINAVPFQSYYSLAPSDFRIGKYAGLTMVYTPNRGFENIVFNIVATDIVAAPV